MFETALVSLVESYGQIGLTLVMIIQTIVAPIPSEALLIFAGAVMNIWDVLVFGGSGLIIGSAIAFFIARKGGRPVVNVIIGKKWTDTMDDWISRNGVKSILLTRLIPVIPFDLVSYVSGVTKIRFVDYMIVTVIGAIPRVFILAYMGDYFGNVFIQLGGTIEIIFVGGIAGFIVLAYLDRKGYIGKLGNTILGKLVKKIWKR